MTTRWFVEVSPVDADTLKERYCVEALQWQQALQQARKLRGDRGPLSRFAIELLEVGYRATDPSVRIRYTVSKAPGDAPLTGGGAANGSVARGAPVAAAATAPPRATTSAAPVEVIAPREPVPAKGALSAQSTSPAVPKPLRSPVDGAQPPSTPGAAAAPPSTSVRPTVRQSTPGAAAAPPSTSARPAVRQSTPGAAAAPPSTSARPAVRRSLSGPAAALPSTSVPVAAPRAVIPAAPAIAPIVIAPVAAAEVPVELAPAEEQEEPIPSLPGLSLISRRSEEPREGAPITYREYAFAVEPGLTPKELDRYARATWEQVRTMLAARVSGKFVQIALFDHQWSGRPERPPVAVLAWKDWRGDPVLQIRAAGAPPAAEEVVPSAAAPVPAAPFVAQPAAAPVPAAPFVAQPAAAPVPAAPAAPIFPGLVAPAPAHPAASPSFPAPVAAEELAPPIVHPLFPANARPLAPVETASGRRGPSEDLISELFEEMHQLHFMPDIVTGAEYVLNVLGRVLPCEGVLVHVFDINTRQFVVVRAVGPSSRSALLHRTPDTFALFRETFRRARALTFLTAIGDDTVGDGRWQRLGITPRAALCGAVQQGGRYLGVIELANPKGGDTFHDSEVNAVDYICEQFADFVASRPIVLDDEAVIPKA